MAELLRSASTTGRINRASAGLMLVFGLSVGLPGPAVPSLQWEYGLSYAGAALHLTMFSVGSAIGSTLDGRLGRRFRRVNLLRSALVMVATGAALTGLAASAVVSLVGVTFMGIGATIAINIAHGVLGSEHRERRGTALASAHMFAAVGLASAAVAVAGARAIGEWRLAFVVPVVLVAVILATRQPHWFPDQRSTAHASGEPSAVSVAVRIGAAVLALSVAVEWAVTFWAATFLRDPVGLPPATADLTTIVVLGAFVAGRLLLRRLTRTHAVVRLLRAAFAVTIALAVPYLGGSRLPEPYDVVVPVGALAVLCLTVTMLFPLSLATTMMAAGASAADQQRASATALGTGAIGAVTMPYALGAIADATTLTTALGVLPIGAALALLGVSAMRRLSPR